MSNYKISVIIPTVLKSTRVLLKLVSILLRDNSVSEIIIIENSGRGLYIPSNEKIKIYSPKENLYVNASWNLGVSLAENERLLIINDDILCCENFCSKVLASGILEKANTGLVGLSNSCIKQFKREEVTDIEPPPITNENLLEFKPLNRYISLGDWGSAFFCKKSNYHNIPDDLKIIFGDNYLLKRNFDLGKINYQITGLNFNHIHSLSSASNEFTRIISSDIRNSKKYL